MVIAMNKHLFEQKLFLGFVNKVTSNIVTAHVPSSRYLNKFFQDGIEFQGGLINSFIIIEGENMGFIGKVISNELPERERIDLSSQALKEKDFHPLIKIEIQSNFNYNDFSFEKSIKDYPNVGSKVYIAREEAVNAYLQQIEVKKYNLKTKDFSHLVNNINSPVNISFQTLFGRHAAVVGTTGSGKSWTTTNLLENMVNGNQNVILLDATGEYRKIAEGLGDKAKIIKLGTSHHINYKKLSLDDLFYLVKPSPNSQAPKLKEAIKTLKLLNCAEQELKDLNQIETHTNGYKLVNLAGFKREPFLQIKNRHANHISLDNLDFDIRALAEQVEKECVYESGFSGNKDKFGDKDDRSLGFCATLVTRIKSFATDSVYSKIFNFEGNNDSEEVFQVINEFKDHPSHLLYINLSELPFTFNTREVVANALAKRLLNLARNNKFKENPLLFMVDEAHQFLNKSVSNDYEDFKLEAFDHIAKEGRKYGLFLCITTQLPRDLPTGTLSQIGTFIVHRLINQRDKEIINNSLPSSNRETVNYLSELGQGEIILSSSEIKQPLILKVIEPGVLPDSETPLFNNGLD